MPRDPARHDQDQEVLVQAAGQGALRLLQREQGDPLQRIRPSLPGRVSLGSVGEGRNENWKIIKC